MGIAILVVLGALLLFGLAYDWRRRRRGLRTGVDEAGMRQVSGHGSVIRGEHGGTDRPMDDHFANPPM